MDRLFKDFQVSCNNCNLGALCLPRGLSAKEINNLSHVVKNNSILQRGEHVYSQGDLFRGIIAIKSGTAKLVTNDTKGNEHILNVLLPGELVGFEGLNTNQYNCSVVALEIMSYCELSSEKFERLCEQIPVITRELFKHSSESINKFQNKIISDKRPAEEKLALFLTDLSDRLHRRGFSSLSFNIPLTRQEMGNHLGLTLETVSRMLQQLQNNGLITVQRKHIEINDLKSLQEICSQGFN